MDLQKTAMGIIKTLEGDFNTPVFLEKDKTLTANRLGMDMRQRGTFFDCTEIAKVAVGDGSFETEMYPDVDVPPSEMARLPSPITFLSFEFKKDINGLIHSEALNADRSNWGGNYKKVEFMQCNYLLTGSNLYGRPSEQFSVFNVHLGRQPVWYGFVDLVEKRFVPPTYLSVFNRMSTKIEFDGCEKFYQALNHALRRVCCLLQIMNTPNFTNSEVTGSRPVRRSIQRSDNIAADRWSKVVWNVGQQSSSAPKDGAEQIHQGLHFRRGHWRKAAEGYKNTVVREGQHYQWIEGYWAGNPAYGFITQTRHPKLSA